MPRPIKPTDHLDKVRHLMGTIPDHEIAMMVGSTAPIVGNYRRKYDIPAYEPYKAQKDQPSPERTGRRRLVRPEKPTTSAPVETKPATRTSRPRASKLDAYRYALGKQPDAVVAQQAKVTVQAVRLYRRKYGISLEEGADQRRGRGQSEGSPSPTSTSVALLSALVKGPEEKMQRSSKLDAFTDQIGKVSDSEIAAQAGVSVSAVGAYRKRHGIASAQASGHPRKQRQVATIATTDTAPEAANTPPPLAIVGPKTGQMGYTVSIEVNGQTRDHIVVAADIVGAANQIAAAQVAGLVQGEVLAIRHLGPALPQA